ncbi:ArsR family transcriptional regulator [Candidatus Bathyarchaeota archaeon]|nr:ArsR family transcriptional regulator [Candidatus Bathyarchaeota archaeon]
MADIEGLLDDLGNDTRRKILFLLAERPQFVSEIAEQLDVGRKAIIEHLRRLEDSRLVSSEEKRLSQGRPRKYYEIRREVFFNVGISPGFVDFSELESGKEIDEVEKLDMEMDELEVAPLQERKLAGSVILNKLESHMERLESEWVEMQRLLNRARRLLNK